MRRGGRGTCIHRFCSNLPITRRFSDERIYFYQTARNFWENLTTGPHFGFWSGMRWKPACSWPRCTSRQAASQTLSPWKQWDCFDNFQASWCSRCERWKPKRWWAEWSRGPGWSSSRAAAGWRAPNNQQRLYFINKKLVNQKFHLPCPATPPRENHTLDICFKSRHLIQSLGAVWQCVPSVRRCAFEMREMAFNNVLPSSM